MGVSLKEKKILSLQNLNWLFSYLEASGIAPTILRRIGRYK